MVDEMDENETLRGACHTFELENARLYLEIVRRDQAIAHLREVDTGAWIKGHDLKAFMAALDGCYRAAGLRSEPFDKPIIDEHGAWRA